MLIKDRGDKQEQKDYGLIVMCLCDKLKRNQLSWLVFLSTWHKLESLRKRDSQLRKHLYETGL